MAKRIGASQLADSLQWVAFAIVLVFLVQVILALFPVALLQPQWMARVSGAIRGTASLAIIGAAMIMLANYIDSEVLPSSDRLRLIQRICTAAAIGFLLLIPLQTYGTLMSIRNQVQEGQTQLNRLVSAANQLQNATNEEQLRTAILAIPGGERLANRPLGADVQTIKTGLGVRLRTSVKRLENQLKDNQTKALQSTIGPLIRDAIIVIAYAVGFAGMGYNAFGQPSPLRRLLKSQSPRLLREQKGSPDL